MSPAAEASPVPVRISSIEGRPDPSQQLWAPEAAPSAGARRPAGARSPGETPESGLGFPARRPFTAGAGSGPVPCCSLGTYCR
ncbi:hypothetical protein GCM10009834_01360 [Streptomonospora arabica]